MDDLMKRRLPQACSCALAIAICLLTVFVQLGCSKEKLEEMAAAVKDQAESVQGKAMEVQQQARDMAASTPLAEVLPATGRTEIGLPSPLETQAGYARFYKIDDARQAVVQFTSYDPDKGPHVFPALLIRAKVDVSSLQMLAGKSIDAEVYLQAVADGPVMTLAPNSTIAFEITSPEPQSGSLVARSGTLTLVDPNGVTTVVNQLIVDGRMP